MMRLRRARWTAIGVVVAATVAGGVMMLQAASDESSFVPVTPTRILDTRIDVGLVGQLAHDTSRLLTVTGPVMTPSGVMTVVPTGATAIVLNVTAVGPTAGGYVTVRPGNAAGAPSTSSLNFAAGAVVPNAVTVELPPAGNLNLYYFGDTGATTHMLIDVVGYYVVGDAGADGADGANGVSGSSFGRRVIYRASPDNLDKGLYASIAIGADGLPIVAYRDDSVGGLPEVRVTHCNDTACATSSSVQVEADTGWAVGLAIGSDGLPIIAHSVGSDLRMTHCNNVLCSGSTATTFVTNNVTDSGDPSIAIGTDGLPIVAHRNSSGDLRVTHCDNVECTTATHTAHDLPSTDTGREPSIAIGTDGFAIIAHASSNNGPLLVTHCENVTCTTATTSSITAGGHGESDPSIAIGIDGLALIAHYDVTAGDLRVAHCNDVACSAATVTAVDVTADNVGTESSITIGVDGLAVIAHRNLSTSDLRITYCSNVDCTSATTIPIVNASFGDGETPSIVIGRDGHVIIAHRADGNNGLQVTKVKQMSWTLNGWES